jgi:predicted permease
MPYILFAFSFLFFKLLASRLHFDRSTTGALTLTAGISSISFVGFPIFEMLFGKEGLQNGILMSQAGSFVVCGTLGIFTASYYSAEQVSWKNISLNIIKFPPFLTFCIALLLNILDLHFPLLINQLLEKIGNPFSFLALVSIGLQISFKRSDLQLTPLFYGLLYKLLVAPILIFFLYVLIFEQYSPLGKLCVIGAALGSMNTATIIAVNYRLNPALATQMVSISIPLSLVNVVIWYAIMQYF